MFIHMYMLDIKDSRVKPCSSKSASKWVLMVFKFYSM